MPDLTPLHIGCGDGVSVVVGCQLDPHGRLAFTVRASGGVSTTAWLAPAARQALVGHVALVDGGETEPIQRVADPAPVDGAPGFQIEPGALHAAVATHARAKVMLEMLERGFLGVEQGVLRDVLEFLLDLPGGERR
jgi:hypothetical protein